MEFPRKADDSAIGYENTRRRRRRRRQACVVASREGEREEGRTEEGDGDRVPR